MIVLECDWNMLNALLVLTLLLGIVLTIGNLFLHPIQIWLGFIGILYIIFSILMYMRFKFGYYGLVFTFLSTFIVVAYYTNPILFRSIENLATGTILTVFKGTWVFLVILVTFIYLARPYKSELR